MKSVTKKYIKNIFYCEIYVNFVDLICRMF